MRGRERIAGLGRGEDHHAGRRLRGEAAGRLHLVDPLADRADDPPAARCTCRRRSRARRRSSPRSGCRSGRSCPRRSSASAITPIVFCASFAPCVNAIHVPEKSCPMRNVRLPTPGVSRWKSQKIASSSRNAAGERDRRRPERRDHAPCARGRASSRRSSPDCASAAPTRPPISACDDDDGRPSHHVIRFQMIAPITAASTVCSRREVRVDDPLADGRRDRGRHERAGEVRDRRDQHRQPRRERARRDATSRPRSPCRGSRS